MLLSIVKMLKKKLGIEGIEKGRFWGYRIFIFKVPPILIIPEGVESIGYHAFDDCMNLKEVIIPEGVKEIGKGAFADCKNLRKVEIPESVELIMDYAFVGCRGLKKIKVPKNVKELREGAFYCCRNANIILQRPLKEFKSIGSHTFGFSKGIIYVEKETGN